MASGRATVGAMTDRLCDGAGHTGSTSADLPGWISRFGVWTAAAAGNDLAALLDWVG